MQRYSPGLISDPAELDNQRLLEYLQGELYKLSASISDAGEGRGDVWSTEPGKKRTGQLVFADGLTWDPGYGAGYYFWDGYSWIPSFWAPRRNLLIGGDFTTNPWQRGVTFAAAANGYYADRWYWNHSSAAVVTVQKTVDAPTLAQANVNTQHCLDVDITTADASIAAGDYAQVGQCIEGLIAKQLGLGLAGTRYFTLSFWVKSSKTGVHCVSFANSAKNRSYVAQYTVNAANTWEFKYVVVPVDTSGTWLYDTGVGLRVRWALAGGSTYQTAANAWAAGDFLTTSSQVNCLDNTANNFKIALAQLNYGALALGFEQMAVPFVYLSALRYYQSFIDRAGQGIVRIYEYTTVGNYGIVSGSFLTPMRIAPVGTVIGTWNVTACNQPGIGITSVHGYEMYAQATATGIIDAFSGANIGVVFDAEFTP